MADENEFSDEEEYEEDYAQSENGETTEAEKEIVNFWDGLKEGVMSHPVRLQVQCLLYIIGHISFNAVGTGLPPNSLGLLPRFIRIKLLLLLPAVDVAKLEGTPVTSGISMNEIWETIYKERLPLHKKKVIKAIMGSTISTPADLQEEGVESASWKNIFFDSIFLFSQMTRLPLEDKECSCVYNHFLPDLFYSMDTFYSDPFSLELYQCFNEESSLSIHEVYRCAHKCPRLTPGRYCDMFPNISSPQRRDTDYRAEVVKVLAGCNASLKHLHISDAYCEKMAPYLKDPVFVDCFSKLLPSVEGVSIHSYCTKDKQLEFSLKYVLDIIFVQIKCPIKFVKAHTGFDVLFPLLIASQCNLKQLEVNVFIDEETSSPIVTRHHETRRFQSIIIAESLSHSLINVLQRHQGIQKFTFEMDGLNEYQLEDIEFVQCITDLMFRPVFKELVFKCFYYLRRISPDIVLCLFRKFFSSPYPVSMTVSELNCPEFPVNTDPFTINHDQAASKSLELVYCDLSPNFFSLLPHSLALKSLKLNDYAFTVIPSIADLESINVEHFSLSCGYISEDTMSVISSLFCTVNTQHLDLSIGLRSNITDKFIGLLTKVTQLLHIFEFINWDFPLDKFVSIMEAIFFSISPTNLSRFELSLDSHFVDADVANALLKSWERCSAVKLRKIKICHRLSGKLNFVNTLLEMANEVFVEKL